MTESEKAYQHDQEQGAELIGFSGGTIRRAGAAYEKIKRGEKVDLKEVYKTKPAPVYDFDFSQLNITE